MTFLQAVVLSLLQGVSELFPISSLGHSVILPRLLHWGINQKSDTWLAFLVALHIGTATALLIYFRDDWVRVVQAFIRSVENRRIGQDPDERLAWMVIVGTIPAGLVGLVLEKPLRNAFSNPTLAAVFLIVNGIIMFAGERLLRQRTGTSTESSVPTRVVLHAAPGGSDVRPQPAVSQPGTASREISDLSWQDAAIVGFAQIGALIPGISRSGITMVAGLAAGLSHEAAARYAFLLATPIIGAAGVLELPKLLHHSARSILGDAVIGAILAGIAAYVSVRFLMRYFEFGRLDPFAYYCIAAGSLSLLLLSVT